MHIPAYRHGAPFLIAIVIMAGYGIWLITTTTATVSCDTSTPSYGDVTCGLPCESSDSCDSTLSQYQAPAEALAITGVVIIAIGGVLILAVPVLGKLTATAGSVITAWSVFAIHSSASMKWGVFALSVFANATVIAVCVDRFPKTRNPHAMRLASYTGIAAVALLQAIITCALLQNTSYGD